ncbi:hypothetical protein TIFTF001_019939 [Ficus carica]|uniref:DUF1985 domain-containing protein n=1 Tax=Ficus carica TaxID=3494 RepID=A0AA88DAK1_FICCA|nr:hypothetical protein TIFTF001_019939 [Ficus carica]
MGDALWFEVGEELDKFSINEFYLITDMKYVGSTHLAPAVDNRLMSRYFSTLQAMSRKHLEMQLPNAKFDNDDDIVKLGLLSMIFCIPLANENFVKIDPKYFALADNLEEFNAFPWSVLTWEATRAAIYNATIPTIAGKFMTKHVEAIPLMLSWTSVDNVKFDAMMSALTDVGEKQLWCLMMMPNDKEMKEPCVAQLYLKDPTVVPQAPRKTPITQSSTATNYNWLEFQKEIRREGNPTTTYRVNYRHKRNVHNDDSDAMKTNSDDLRFGPQDDGFLDSDIGFVADKGVKAAMDFLNADKEDKDKEKKDEEEEENEDDERENDGVILKNSILDEDEEKEVEEDEGRYLICVGKKIRITKKKEKREKKYENGKGKEEEKKDEKAKGEEEERNDEEAAMKQDKEERKNKEAAKEQEENINDQVVTQWLSSPCSDEDGQSLCPPTRFLR